MENLDELEVMFQHINVTGASSVIPGAPTNAAPIEVGDDSTEGEDDATIVDDEKKGGKRKINNDLPQNPKKKGRNPMVRQVTRLIDVISTGKTKNAQKVEDDIIELIEQAVNAGAYEGSDEHFMATKLFIKQEYRAVFKSFKTNEGKVAWLKRMYEERKRD
ncbi:zinc finger CCCH domain-containing protein 43-like [Phragmites australis]|uniref:zinc finger CCCH domain-containing protein 43-like n=1 Tax=Phragmites australis TaxID=29695 RepID=UPI002D76BBAF|nr:zinc finger CCCH domain-containing protein 43-like [Phragmites australis]